MKRAALVFVLGAILCSFGSAFAAPEKDQIACTVCGYLIDKDKALTAPYEGTTYYFCNAGCKAYFMLNPAGFATGMDRDPVCGMAVKKGGSVEAVHNGRQIHFCSNECRDKYLASPTEFEINFDIVSNEVKPQKEMKYSATFEGRPYYFVSAENKATFEKNPDAYIYAECPITGEVFLRKDAGAQMVYKGATYYFCCKNCLEKFKKDPKKHTGPARAGKACTGGKGSTEMKGGGGSAAGCPAKKTSACPMSRRGKV